MKTDWETPSEFFKKLNDEFHFTLDPCATTQTAKCAKYFTEQENGLAQAWTGERVFMNPPFYRIIDWMKKAYKTACAGGLIVALVPAATATRWWHEYAMRASEIRFIRGKINFLSNGEIKKQPRVAVCLVIFRPYLVQHIRFTTMNRE